jgi:hypothetical protein
VCGFINLLFSPLEFLLFIPLSPYFHSFFNLMLSSSVFETQVGGFFGNFLSLFLSCIFDQLRSSGAADKAFYFRISLREGSEGFL